MNLHIVGSCAPQEGQMLCVQAGSLMDWCAATLSPLPCHLLLPESLRDISQSAAT